MITTYVIKTGSTITDSLTLTNPGTSGQLTYQYVGSGYWQHTVDGSTSIDGAIDAFNYGVPSLASAVPTTGRGKFDLDFLGARANAGGVIGFTGTGLLELDVETGLMRITGTLNYTGASNESFQGSAKLVSGTGTFSGSFSNGFLAGPLAGRFYGPQAQEIGATYSGSNAGTGMAIVGTFMGRGGPLAYLTFDPSKVNTSSVGIITTFDAATNKLNASAQRNLPIELRYDAATQTYALVNAQRSFNGLAGKFYNFGFDTELLSNSIMGTTYKYFSVLRWDETRQLSDGASPSKILLTHFIIDGSPTANANVPRIGNAGYDAVLTGILAKDGAAALTNISGSATVFLDFATGKLTTTGRFQDNSGALPVDDFSGTAALSASSSKFTGQVTVKNAGISGAWTGNLFGADVSEFASTLSLSNGLGSVFSGLLLGRANPDLKLDYTGLLDLTAPRTFNDFYSHHTGTVINTASNGIQFTFDRTAGTYLVKSSAYTHFNLPDVSVGPGDIVAAESDATFTHYRVTIPTSGLTYNVDLRLLKPGSGNSQMPLTYTSFATARYQPSGGYPNTEMAFVYGMKTPAVQVPRGGTASYNAIVAGGGQIFPAAGGVAAEYKISGTALLNFDFTKATMAGSFNLSGVNLANASTRNFGTFAFDGSIPFANVGPSYFQGFFFNPQGNNIGSLTGGFYGPLAPEVGGVFYLNPNTGTEQWFISGAFAGKKN